MRKYLLLVLCLVLAGCRPQYDSSSRNILKYGRSIVKVEVADGSGTGFAVDTPNGLHVIITNAHVCEGATMVNLHSDALDVDYVGAKILKSNRGVDLCMIEGPASIPSLPVESFTGETKEKIVVVGHPLGGPVRSSTGRADGTGLTGYPILAIGMSQEECNQLGGEPLVRLYNGDLITACGLYTKAFTSQVKIEPGSSGSPMINRAGHVIGVVFGMSGDPNSNEVGAVPGSLLQDFLK